MTKQLEFIDTLVADGRTEFSFSDAVERLNVTPSAAANALRQLQNKGFVCRVRRGSYAVRPLGSLGSSMATDDLPGAVGLAFGARPHRIAYLSALSEFGLLTHPVRRIFVACVTQVRFDSIAQRPLHSVLERSETIHAETFDLGGSKCSTLERGLLECAVRVDLVGGIERLAEAVQAGLRDADGDRMAVLARQLSPRGLAAERRLASLAHVLGLTTATSVPISQPMIRLDPRETDVTWVDERYRVSWHLSIDELRASVEN